MNYNYRLGEEGASIPPRSDRFFKSEESWFFTTREGADVGPYESRISAESGLADFLDFVQLAEPTTLLHLSKALTKEGSISLEQLDM